MGQYHSFWLTLKYLHILPYVLKYEWSAIKGECISWNAFDLNLFETHTTQVQFTCSDFLIFVINSVFNDNFAVDPKMI